MKKAIENYGYNSIFPTRLRELLDETKKAHQEIADLCHTQRQAVGNWVNGSARPDILSLAKIAAFFGVSTDYLLGLSENKTTDKATLEMCKSLNLSDDTIFLLSCDGEFLSKGTVHCDESDFFYFASEASKAAFVFETLANDHRRRDVYYSLLSCLYDFFTSLRASNETIIASTETDNTLNIGSGEQCVFTSFSADGARATLLSVKDMLISAHIQEIIAKLTELKKEAVRNEERGER